MSSKGMALPSHPKRNPSTGFRKVGDEGGLAVLPGRAEVNVLNPVASTVFALLDGSHSIDDLVQAVMDEYEVDPAEAREGVLEFLHQLADHGMLMGFEA